MRRVIGRTSALLYALGIVLSLTFGATQAFAKRDPTCNLTGATTCLSQAECDGYCQGLGLPGGLCNLSNHCCFCRIE